MNSIMLYLLMFCGGMAIALQPSINARLAQKTGLVQSSCISFAVGTLVLLVTALLVGRGSFRGIAAASPWELTGGLLGAFFVTMTIFVVPRIGTAAAMAAVIGAQLTTGVLLDHFGLLGGRHVPLDSTRSIGIALLLAGGWLVFRRAAG
jgi:transporter family-2 protein